MLRVLAILFLFLPQLLAGQHVPSFEEVISLRSVGALAIAADGRHVAYTVQTTDWNDNRFDSEIWLSKDGQAPFQLTHTSKESSSGAAFSPDGKWLAFLADRGNKTQLYAISLSGGEAWPVTNEDVSIDAFEWHPSGEYFILLKAEGESKEKKELKKRYGAFATDDKEYDELHLWKVDFKPDSPNPSELPCYEENDSLKLKAGCIQLPKPVQLTKGNFTVVGFLPSPDGSTIAFAHQPDPLINSSLKSDISLLDISNNKTSLLVSNKGPDVLEDWSPDSKEILYTTSLDDSTSYYYTNSRLYAMGIASRAKRQLAQGLDEDLGGFTWTPRGIFASLWNKTTRPLYRIDPASGSYAVWLSQPSIIMGNVYSNDGDKMAVVGRGADQLNEVFISSVENPKPAQLSAMTAQIKTWKVAQSEVISWKSKDGAIIEGVLHKPANFDPSRKYPLLVVIHGGPTGIDLPTPVPGYVYPILQWLDKGCVVLRPNYRGSAGYGEKFRSLNVKNLGVGDAWDVMSGVEYLASRGIVDKTKMGCMGWSQGGYISAYLTTNTKEFKAISVGAGISNWMTYYVNTDIHPFTQQYLKATPWSDEAIYRKTSPMTNISKASTPTLIQHGENDKRVPIANAYELLQGLRDHHVPAKLIVYKGFGHGITKPKERLAATWHNWQWFNRYLWNEKVELPVGAAK